jgi:acid stress-induced BolA-like protein IbaG/YrbA
MQPEEVKRLIEQGILGAQAWVTGDGSHFEAVIVAEEFRGKSMVQQHKTVYAALGNAFESAIHALSMQCYTPEEWAAKQAAQRD